MHSKSYGGETGYVDSRGDLHRAWSHTCPATHCAGFRMNSLVRQRFYSAESSLTTHRSVYEESTMREQS